MDRTLRRRITVTLVYLLVLAVPIRTAANWMYLGLAGSSPSNNERSSGPEPSAARSTPIVPSTSLDIRTSQLDVSNSNNPSDRIRYLCNALPGLVSQQIEVCETQPDAIASVSEGARKALLECQFQFRHERWNCTTTTTTPTSSNAKPTTMSTMIPSSKKGTSSRPTIILNGRQSGNKSSVLAEDTDVFGYTLQRGSRETAFVYAVTSAGVVHAITQACSSGNLTECSCDITKEGTATPEGWKWGGCSDNIEHGLSFSRQFVDAPERIKHLKSQNVRNKMNLHNNEAGRKAIEKLMRTQCRCHGVSGSCELKTCWRTLPSFNQVGDFLKKKYANAVRVKLGSTPALSSMSSMSSSASSTGTRHRRLRRQQDKKDTNKRNGRRTGIQKMVVAKDDLVHIHKSPNYCLENRTKGILGTRGRPCNKTAVGSESCDLLCCGRGYNTRVVRHVERCHCKFIWCCYVKCKVCETMMDVHTCK